MTKGLSKQQKRILEFLKDKKFARIDDITVFVHMEELLREFNEGFKAHPDYKTYKDYKDDSDFTKAYVIAKKKGYISFHLWDEFGRPTKDYHRGTKEPSVRRALAILEKRGLVSVKRDKEGHRGIKNLYSLKCNNN